MISVILAEYDAARGGENECSKVEHEIINLVEKLNHFLRTEPKFAVAWLVCVVSINSMLVWVTIEQCSL